MKRDMLAKLTAWKNQEIRKPLIINGARQVGKTYLIKRFAKTFPRSIYINFEEMPQLHEYFTKDLRPESIISKLALYFQIKIMPDTLIIFDEIQACSEAITSLKYFNEESPEQPIIAAGSLLGVKLKRGGISFPVGKVQFINLFPMSFFEFLSAFGKEQWRELLETPTLKEIPNNIHEELVQLLRLYFYIGGMPEAVASYIEHQDTHLVREIQTNILKSYQLDFAKYATPAEVMKIMGIWQALPAQLSKENKKFIFSAISKSARGREYMSALHWLQDAGLIYFCKQVSTPKLPLSAYADNNHFKVYLFDVGLLGSMSQLSASSIMQGNILFTEFKGALTENYVATALVNTHDRESLFYWTSPGRAEVDFILNHEDKIYPFEIKAGTTGHMKSLTLYQELYNPPSKCRASLQNLQYQPGFINYPLYLSARFPFL